MFTRVTSPVCLTVIQISNRLRSFPFYQRPGLSCLTREDITRFNPSARLNSSLVIVIISQFGPSNSISLFESLTADMTFFYELP